MKLQPDPRRASDFLRSPWRLGLLLLGMSVWVGCAGTPEPIIGEPNPTETSSLRPRRPNVLFIMADDHATRAISAYGSPLLQTPNLDRLAREGVLFSRVYCTNAICAPSRASIITGLFSHKHGVIDNAARFDPTQETVQQAFSDAGYRTALFGKWHLKSDPSGFDQWAVLPGQGHYYNPDFKVNGRLQRFQGHSTAIITDMTVNFIEGFAQSAASGQPFLAMMQFKAPHRNWMAAPDLLTEFADQELPEPATLFDRHTGFSLAAYDQEMTINRHLDLAYDLKLPVQEENAGELGNAMNGILERMNPEQRAVWEAAYTPENEAFAAADPSERETHRWKYQRYVKDYLRCIKGIDRSVGRVLKKLEETGLLDNTIVVYTSDQGFFLGEHGWYDKRFFYEPSSRMPLMIRYPKSIAAGRVSSALIHNVDFAPTLLEAVGIEALPQAQGESFWDVACGTADGSERSAIYAHYFEYPGVHAVKRHYGIRTDRHKLIHYYHDIDAWELFDLALDPGETHNRYDDPSYYEVRADLQRQLRELQRRYDDLPENFTQGLHPSKVSHDAIGAAVEFAQAPGRSYGKSPAAVLVDGEFRASTPYSGRVFSGWLGFRQHDFSATLDLGRVRPITEVGLHVQQDRGSWIYRPRRVVFSGSEDGVTFENFDEARPSLDVAAEGAEWITARAEGARYRYLRVVAERVQQIPDGEPGAGQSPWVFVDEVSVECGR